eukprot:SAG31_NODE_4327_length_3353_cov_4.742778_4_plen_56_part_00
MCTDANVHSWYSSLPAWKRTVGARKVMGRHYQYFFHWELVVVFWLEKTIPRTTVK